MNTTTLWAGATAFGLNLSLTLSPALADTWTLNGDASRLSFGSVKAGFIGEVHSFGDLSGTVDTDGATQISIGLASVDTMIDIRNERLIEHVFAFAPSAGIAAQVDMARMEALMPGDTDAFELEAVLSFLGQDIDLFADVFVARLGEDSLMVTTDGMVFLDTDELGIDAGIDKLQELASLDSITRAAPVTFRLVFDRMPSVTN